MKSKGILITVEGIHGAGKTIICKMLIEKLKEEGIDAILSIDQAGTELGKKIREINLKGDYSVDVLTEALLIAAARRQNIAEIIKPNLIRGKIIISERFIDAYFAFQEYARALPHKFLECINSAIAEGLSPDLTILLDLNAETALNRLKDKEKHRIEKESPEFHKKVRLGYIEQAKNFPNRIKIINADRPISDVFNEVWNIVKKYLISKEIIKC